MSNHAQNSGATFGGLLFLVLLTLKLLHQIDWSWWWVFAPFWAPFAVLGAFCVFCLLMHGLQWATGGRRK